MPFTSVYVEADGKMVCGWVFKWMGTPGLTLPTPGPFILGYSGMSRVVFLIMKPEWQKGKKVTRLIVFSRRVPMTYSEGRNAPSISNLLCDLGRTWFLHFKREQVESSDLWGSAKLRHRLIGCTQFLNYESMSHRLQAGLCQHTSALYFYLRICQHLSICVTQEGRGRKPCFIFKLVFWTRREKPDHDQMNSLMPEMWKRSSGPSKKGSGWGLPRAQDLREDGALEQIAQIT